ncbi:acyl transferase/acyl hydrolase/lysophospholipase [Geopyxis carbonaria]|nr:acyl transferase/acyl hydrolase/lysophospholipase [Geopyxis carbonaria]
MDGYSLHSTRSPSIDHGPRSQAPLRLLSLDGGGVRGYSTLLLIQELMLSLFVSLEGRAPTPSELPRPCDHFDLIGGTGTGGLIAMLLGRLRLDVETCKAEYVRVSRAVFESDKTIAGLPYRKTLFKASRLEEEIKRVVAEYAPRGESPRAGDDATISNFFAPSPNSPGSSSYTDSTSSGSRTHSNSHFSGASRRGSSATSAQSAHYNGAGDPNAPLQDPSPLACRTFFTAHYASSTPDSPPCLLRTYPSKYSTATPASCTLWQAGRATCAHAPAFKPITIGPDIFLDDGPGRYSPVAQVLEEALVHEWPGRPVGVLISIGSGLPPTPTTPTSTKKSFLHRTPLGRFADARERHAQKMRDAEAIHQELLAGLHRTGVEHAAYFRLNVEVGVGDYGINEWSRMAEISADTRRYLARGDVAAMNRDAGERMAGVHRRLWGGGTVRLLERELPDLPGMVAEQSDEEEDEEVLQTIAELQNITRRIHA